MIVPNETLIPAPANEGFSLVILSARLLIFFFFSAVIGSNAPARGGSRSSDAARGRSGSPRSRRTGRPARPARGVDGAGASSRP